MNIAPLSVREPCQPYPEPRNSEHPHLASDYRETQWLSKVVDGLSEDELRKMARDFLLLHPRSAEQALLWIGYIRCAEQRSDRELAKHQHP